VKDVTPPAAVRSVVDLKALAVEINAAHKAGEASFRIAGDALIKARAQVDHGSWLKWLETNVAFSVRTAQLYIRIAENWSKCATLAHLDDAIESPDEPAPLRRDDAPSVGSQTSGASEKPSSPAAERRTRAERVGQRPPTPFRVPDNRQPSARQPGEEPEEESSADAMKRINATIESFCRSVTKLVEDELPRDIWISDMNRREGIRRKFADGCEMLRACKCSGICPRCDGKGTDKGKDCRPCQGTGRLPKLNLDQLG